MPTVDICLSPELLHLHDLSNSSVVVIDILRASSCMVTALASDVASIRPVRKVEECISYKEKGYLIAAERDGKKVEGFDLGNSPFSYMSAELKGKKVALTTTNGTQAIKMSQATAKEVLVGAFLNKKSLGDYLLRSPNDVLLLCSGWKGQVNIEDTLFAGALLHYLSPQKKYNADAALLAKNLYEQYQNNLMAIVSQSSHVQRLNNLGIEKDILFCLEENRYEVLTKMQGDELVKI